MNKRQPLLISLLILTLLSLPALAEPLPGFSIATVLSETPASCFQIVHRDPRIHAGRYLYDGDTLTITDRCAAGSVRFQWSNTQKSETLIKGSKRFKYPDVLESLFQSVLLMIQSKSGVAGLADSCSRTVEKVDLPDAYQAPLLTPTADNQIFSIQGLPLSLTVNRNHDDQLKMGLTDPLHHRDIIQEGSLDTVDVGHQITLRGITDRQALELAQRLETGDYRLWLSSHNTARPLERVLTVIPASQLPGMRSESSPKGEIDLKNLSEKDRLRYAARLAVMPGWKLAALQVIKLAPVMPEGSDLERLLLMLQTQELPDGAAKSPFPFSSNHVQSLNRR